MINNNLKERFLLFRIIPSSVSDESALKDLRELKSLVETYGGEVVELVIQHREIHDKGMYIGRGKILEIAELIKMMDIDVVVLGSIVKPGQIFEIQKNLSQSNPRIKIWDRIDLILEIFSKHANTAEAKLQIELAAMRHMGPRIYGMGHVLSRQAGGIGTLGIGETNTELMKRHWKNQIKKVEDKLLKLSTDRQRQLQRREKVGLKTVSIIGYTNAGKTSLFNLLTGKKNIVDDALFVTLDSSVGKIIMPQSKKEILLSDTIGFINNLPAKLIESFRSTLLESIHADVLLHVIDLSDPEMPNKIRVVEQTVFELGLQAKPKIYVFNKTDQLNGFRKKDIIDQYARFTPQFISVKYKRGIEGILAEIESEIMNTVWK